MKKRSIIFSLFILVMNASAQDSVSTSNPLPQAKKNELSINTIPCLGVLIASESENNRFSIGYKRNLNERSALRISLAVDIVKNSFYNSFSNDKIILSTDSVLIKRKTELQNYVSPHLNIGYERLFGKRKLKWFYGGDIVIGYFKTLVLEREMILHRDTIKGTAGWLEDQFDSRTVSRTDSKIFSVGLSPFFGAKYPLSKRFSISAQIGVAMSYNTAAVSEIGSGSKKNYQVSTFDFNESPGLLNDISIVYKF